MAAMKQRITMEAGLVTIHSTCCCRNECPQPQAAPSLLASDSFTHSSYIRHRSYRERDTHTHTSTHKPHAHPLPPPPSLPPPPPPLPHSHTGDLYTICFIKNVRVTQKEHLSHHRFSHEKNTDGLYFMISFGNV